VKDVAHGPIALPWLFIEPNFVAGESEEIALLFF
jgi:hypothetical protein